jgi:hypothetical protein
MDLDVRIAQENIRRYREMLEQERDALTRAKLEGLIMAEEDKVEYLSRECFEMEDRVSISHSEPAAADGASPELPVEAAPLDDAPLDGTPLDGAGRL